MKKVKKMLLVAILLIMPCVSKAQFIMGYETPVESAPMRIYNYNSPLFDVQSTASSLHSIFTNALQLYYEGNYTGAINTININISTFATSSDYYLRGMCNEALKNYKYAKKDYKKAWYKGFGSEAVQGYYRMKNTLKEIQTKKKQLYKAK